MRKLLVFIFLLLGNYCIAQVSTVEDTIGNNQIAAVILATQQNQGISSPLYNGIIHTGYAKSIVGTPYYLSPDWIDGSIYFENTEYLRVPLKYDLVSDQLIVKRPDGFGINLFSPRIGWFIINNAKFIYIDNKQYNGALPIGFYQLMQNGKVKLLYKRSRKINEKITNKLEQQFLDNDKYYIIQDQTIHEVKSLSSVMNVLNDHRKEVKEFLKSNHLKYRKDPEDILNKMVAYYNQIH